MLARNHIVCWHSWYYAVAENLTRQFHSGLWIPPGIPKLEASLNIENHPSWVFSHVLWVPVHPGSKTSSLLQKTLPGSSWIGVELTAATESCSQTGCYCCHSESAQASPQHPALLPSPEPFCLQAFMTWPITPFLCCFQVLKLVKSHRLLLLCVQIRFAISYRAGCYWFVQVPAWRWYGQCQAITVLLFAICLLLYIAMSCALLTQSHQQAV